MSEARKAEGAYLFGVGVIIILFGVFQMWMTIAESKPLWAFLGFGCIVIAARCCLTNYKIWRGG